MKKYDKVTTNRTYKNFFKKSLSGIIVGIEKRHGTTELFTVVTSDLVVEYIDSAHFAADPKEMTMEEINKELGYKVKVIE